MSYRPEALDAPQTSNSLHFLVGSDQSLRYIHHENTRVHVFVEDPLIDYCIEHSRSDGNTERIYTSDGRVAFILSRLGYTTISHQYAPDDHVVGYEIAGYRDEPGVELDVLDYDGKTSLVLDHFTVDDEAEDDPREGRDIPIGLLDDISITVELDEDRELTLHHGNTELVIYDRQSPHRKFSHVRVKTGETDDGIPIFTLLFDNYHLMRVLRRKRFPRKIQPQIMDPALISYLASGICAELDEDQAHARFSISGLDDEPDEYSTLQ